MCMSTLFGYRFSKADGVQIDPGQAAIVREIYARVIRGDSLNSIARWLNREGQYGEKWKASRLRELIENEKYTGNALLQKTFVNNHIEKKLVKNRGELPKYFATETHPAIVDQATFDAAQEALARIAAQYHGKGVKMHHAFTGLLLCPACNRHYTHVTNHGLSRWACPTFMLEGKAFCPSRKIPEEILMQVTCDLLGWDHFNEEALRSSVDHIVVRQPNVLVFHMKDGTEKRAEWAHRSRAESWTPEMKKKAAEAKRLRRKSGY